MLTVSQLTVLTFSLNSKKLLYFEKAGSFASLFFIFEKKNPMRKIFIISILLLTGIVLTISSCKKKDTDEDDPIPVDTTFPVITLMGDANMTITLNSTFTDPGATAVDDFDGDLTAGITVTGSVNKDLAGCYTLTYSVSDAAGHTTTKNRTVTIENAAHSWFGNYSASDDWNSDGIIDYTWTEPIYASSTINNRVVFTKFAYFTNCDLRADINGTTVSYSGSQTVACGFPAKNRTFTISSGSIFSNTITINYHEVDDDGFTTDGIDVFVKQ
jgi:hypothetical protein